MLNWGWVLMSWAYILNRGTEVDNDRMIDQLTAINSPDIRRPFQTIGDLISIINRTQLIVWTIIVVTAKGKRSASLGYISLFFERKEKPRRYPPLIGGVEVYRRGRRVQDIIADKRADERFDIDLVLSLASKRLLKRRIDLWQQLFSFIILPEVSLFKKKPFVKTFPKTSPTDSTCSPKSLGKRFWMLNWGWVLMSWVSNRLRDLDNRCIYLFSNNFLWAAVGSPGQTERSKDRRRSRRGNRRPL